MKKILIDDEKCMACHSCEIACTVAHSTAKNLYGALLEPVVFISGMHVESGGKGRGFPLGCRHCQDPQCARACVTKALYLSPQGVVMYDSKRCIGCHMCFIACPFGAIEEGKNRAESYSISKCDLCMLSGEEPGCVTACLTQALTFEDPDEYSRNKRIKYLFEMSAPSEETVA